MEIADYNEHDLTQSLSFAATVGCEESGGRHNFCRATSVSGARTEQSEVLGKLDSLVWSTCLANTKLKGWNSSLRVLSPSCHNPTFAAVCKLLVVRNTRHQIYNSGVFLAGVRNVSFELGAVTLLRCLRPHHRPYHFLFRPSPPHRPPGAHYMAVHLEVVQCDYCLYNHKKSRGCGITNSLFTGSKLITEEKFLPHSHRVSKTWYPIWS